MLGDKCIGSLYEVGLGYSTGYVEVNNEAEVRLGRRIYLCCNDQGVHGHTSDGTSTDLHGKEPLGESSCGLLPETWSTIGSLL